MSLFECAISENFMASALTPTKFLYSDMDATFANGSSEEHAIGPFLGRLQFMFFN